MRHFVSDNASGIHPIVLDAISKANTGHAVAYGHDAWTEELEQLFRRLFGEQARGFSVTTGTAANVLALQSLAQSYHGIVCSISSHLYRDECGAPEKALGCKLLPIQDIDGKIHPESIDPVLHESHMVHRVQPKVVSISQCTEWGTVYTQDEVRTLAKYCHDNDMYLHLDGARLANAAAALDASLSELTTDLGVDVLSLGGTKNGCLAAEAVVFLREDLGEAAPFFRKQQMQLASKARFIAAQLIALYSSKLWKENALHANAMAALLAGRLEGFEEIDIVRPVQSNVVFARIPAEWVPVLQEKFAFALWDAKQSIVRLMTTFDTQEEDIERFCEAASSLVGVTS